MHNTNSKKNPNLHTIVLSVCVCVCVVWCVCVCGVCVCVCGVCVCVVCECVCGVCVVCVCVLYPDFHLNFITSVIFVIVLVKLILCSDVHEHMEIWIHAQGPSSQSVNKAYSIIIKDHFGISPMSQDVHVHQCMW